MSEQVQAAMTTLKESVRKFIDKAVGEARTQLMADIDAAIKALPVPKDGERGADAVVDYEQVKGIIEGLIPAPVAGKDGKDGVNGADGRNGTDAVVDYEAIKAMLPALIPAPIPGEKGADGKDGINGLNGKDAQDGQDGKDGIDGRDALDLEILPAISPLKSYPARTFAKHRGGLIRATRATTPCADGASPLEHGWECVVEGIAHAEVAQGEDLRTFAVGIETTSGAAFMQKFAVPVLIDRGIFNAEAAYAKGDVVSSNGSMWIAQDATTGERPGGSQVWRLSVKHGRDGKDFDAVKQPRPQEPVRLR